MTLTCLAIVGKENEPLYVRDAENVKIANENGGKQDSDTSEAEDVFGILAWNNQPDSLTIRHEVCSYK